MIDSVAGAIVIHMPNAMMMRPAEAEAIRAAATVTARQRRRTSGTTVATIRWYRSVRRAAGSSGPPTIDHHGDRCDPQPGLERV